MRIRAYSQLLESYKSVEISSMARTFGVTVEFLDRELSRFIFSGRINAKIDKVPVCAVFWFEVDFSLVAGQWSGADSARRSQNCIVHGNDSRGRCSAQSHSKTVARRQFVMRSSKDLVS
jgi:hypothetical protein